MTQTNDVRGTAALRQNGLDRVLESAITEISKERIASAQRQKSERGTLSSGRLGEKPIHNLVGSAISADCEEVPDPACIGGAGHLCGLTGSTCSSYIDIDTTGPETIQDWRQQLSAAAAARGWIHDCQIALRQGVVLTQGGLVLAFRLA
jgi:hypothetical protein